MSVQEYLDKHLLSRKIEDAVNAAVRAKTSDPVLFISNHMKKAVPAVITKIRARQILDSRGIPTVEVDLYTNKGVYRASAPSGASTGMYEAVELRDGDKGKYLGKGVSKAVNIINDKISEALMGMDPQLQSQIDQAMIDLDKTDNKAELGANAMLAVSIAACKAGAAEKEVPLYKHISDLSGKSSTTLPVPAITVISGGKHAGNNLAVQEVMILPVGASNFEEAMQMGSETYHHLKAIISEKYGSSGCNVGDDGGFAPNIPGISEGLDLVIEAIDRAGYNGRIKLAIDVAATDFCIGKKYDLDIKSPNKSGQNFKTGEQNFKTGEDMIELYARLCTGKSSWNCDRGHISSEAGEGYANWGVIVSHRCGETDDSFIADLVVGLAAGQMKSGVPCRGERLVKYNQGFWRIFGDRFISLFLNSGSFDVHPIAIFFVDVSSADSPGLTLWNFKLKFQEDLHNSVRLVI